MTNNKNLRVAVVGLGQVTRNIHFPAYKNLGGKRLKSSPAVMLTARRGKLPKINSAYPKFSTIRKK